MSLKSKNIFCFGVFVICTVFKAQSVNAQVAGQFTAPILRISPYARQAAMGEAFTALANDINVMRYNIGGLGHLRNTMLSTHFHQWIDDTYQGAIEAALPTPYGVIGFNLAYFSEGELRQIDSNFNPTGTVFNNNDILLSIGGGRMIKLFKQTFSFGAAVKVIRQNLVDQAGSAIGLDVGALYALKHISVGATLQNFTVSKLDLGSNSTSAVLPEMIRGGIATRLPIGENFKLNLALDAARFLDNDDDEIKLYGGGELIVAEVFAMRGGYKIHDSEISRWGAGFGLMIPMSWLGGASTAFDYAYSPLEAFDSQAHRFSVSFNFGQLVSSDPSALNRELEAARKARQEAEEARLAALEAENRVRELERQLAERLKEAQRIAEEAGRSIDVESTPRGDVQVTLRHVNFDFDKSDIRPDMFPVMDKLVEILDLYEDSPMWISGHTDSIGTDEYNIKLAQRRINSVMRYLTGKGVLSTRFHNPIPYGEWKPLTDNSTAEKRFRNRRVEFLLYTAGREPELQDGSIIEQVYVLNDTIVVVGNGRLDYTARIIPGKPPKALIKFDKMYLADPINMPVNRGNVRSARLGFHPEDGSTWVVLDLNVAAMPTLIKSENRVLIVPTATTENP